MIHVTERSVVCCVEDGSGYLDIAAEVKGFIEAVKDMVCDIKFNEVLDEAIRIHRYISDQTFITRKKDYENPFRKMVYQDQQEMQAVLGRVEQNNFVKQIRAEHKKFVETAEALKKRV